MSLAHFYGTAYRRGGQTPAGMNNDIEKFKYFGAESPMAERLAFFNQAEAKLTEDFGTWNTPWGEISRYQR